MVSEKDQICSNNSASEMFVNLNIPYLDVLTR